MSTHAKTVHAKTAGLRSVPVRGRPSPGTRRVVVAALTGVLVVCLTIGALHMSRCSDGQTGSEAGADSRDVISRVAGLTVDTVPAEVEALLPGVTGYELIGVSADHRIISFIVPGGGADSDDIVWSDSRSGSAVSQGDAAMSQAERAVVAMMVEGGWAPLGDMGGGISSFSRDQRDGGGDLSDITYAIAVLYDLGDETTVLIQLS